MITTPGGGANKDVIFVSMNNSGDMPKRNREGRVRCEDNKLFAWTTIRGLSGPKVVGKPA